MQVRQCVMKNYYKGEKYFGYLETWTDVVEALMRFIEHH